MRGQEALAVSKTGESLSCQHVKEVDGRGGGEREGWSQQS